MSKRNTKTVKEATDLKRCECGCGVVVNKRFAQGHDMKLRSAALRAFDGGDDAASDELVKRGWYSASELAERREKTETKVAMKADREAARAAKRAERETAKAEKAEKASAEADEEAEPTPAQPKVSRGRTRRRDEQPVAAAAS